MNHKGAMPLLRHTKSLYLRDSFRFICFKGRIVGISMVHAIVSEGEMQLYISPTANLFYIGERRDGHVIIQRSNAIGRFSRNGAEFSAMPEPLC